MSETVYSVSGLPFIADVHTLVRNTGRQIDWATLVALGTPVTSLPAGTIMVEVVATGLIVPYANRPGTETASMILESNASADDDVELGVLGYGCIIGGVIYSNLLPEAAAVGFATRLTELHAAGTGFKFETYSDNRS